MPKQGGVWLVELILLLLLALTGLVVYEFLMYKSGLSDILGSTACTSNIRLGVTGSGLNLTYSLEERLGPPGEQRGAAGELIVMIAWPRGFPCNTTSLSIVTILVENGRITGYGWDIYDLMSQPYIVPFNRAGDLIVRTPEDMDLPENTSMKLDYSITSSPYGARPAVVVQYKYPSGRGWDVINEYHYDKSTGILLRYTGILGAGREYELQAELRSVELISYDKLYEKPALTLASTSLAGSASGLAIAWLLHRLSRPPRT